MKWKKKNAKPKKRKNTPKVRSISGRKPLNAETLRRDLSDPKRAQMFMDHLADLMVEESQLHSLRFPPGPLLQALDELAETSTDELTALDDPLQQRMTILNRILPRFLTKKFIKQVEKSLLSYLEKKKNSPRHFRAISTGLFFLEFHVRDDSDPGSNPLWNLMFDVSYDEALATAGGAVSPAEQAPPIGSADIKLDGTSDLPDQDLDDQELSESNTELARNALELIDTGKVELGFSLDTVLLGLHEVTTGKPRPPEELANALRESFNREIGVNQWNDLIWGLEYAVEQLEGERQKSFKTVLEASRMLSPKENPVVFALYYKSVTEFYRYLKPGEQDFAKAIAEAKTSAQPILAFAAFLMKSDVTHRALNAYIAATVIDPSDELARIGAGIACWKTESFREARLHFSRAARLWSGYLPADHSNIILANQLAELDNFAQLPQNAYDLVLNITSTPEEEK